jgi:aerobic carbon-monoxide dehydrogenase medium subunit
MKARAFKYFRAESLQDALQAFDRAGGEGCYLAGGQSLVPSLSLRLQAPELLIDISRIEALTGISRSGNVLRVGALTRHAEMLTSPEIARHAPLLRRAVPFVAHPAIRNMGTFGGTIALADPSAEFPAMTLAMDAEFEIVTRRHPNDKGRRFLSRAFRNRPAARRNSDRDQHSMFWRSRSLCV